MHGTSALFKKLQLPLPLSRKICNFIQS